MNMNPMSKFKVGGDGRIEIGGERYAQGDPLPNGLEWLETDENGYALVWDESLWDRYNRTSKDISRKRVECVTPRGVLAKICQLLRNDVQTEEISRQSDDGDFPWFKQDGKVYAHSNGMVD